MATWNIWPNIGPTNNIVWFNNYLQDKIDQRKTDAPKPNNKRTWSKATVTEPTYTAPDGTVHTGMTQEQFNQLQVTQQMESQAYNDRNNTTTANGLDRQKVFQEAINKYRSNPESFSDREKDLLLSVGQQLGYTPENVAAQILWVNPTQAQPANQPTQPAQPSAPATSPAPGAAGQGTMAPSNSAWAGGRDEGQFASENDRKTQGWANAIWFYL